MLSLRTSEVLREVIPSSRDTVIIRQSASRQHIILNQLKSYILKMMWVTGRSSFLMKKKTGRASYKKRIYVNIGQTAMNHFRKG
jgi:hypothetical protein